MEEKDLESGESDKVKKVYFSKYKGKTTEAVGKSDDENDSDENIDHETVSNILEKFDQPAAKSDHDKEEDKIVEKGVMVVAGEVEEPTTSGANQGNEDNVAEKKNDNVIVVEKKGRCYVQLNILFCKFLWCERSIRYERSICFSIKDIIEIDFIY